jgi:ribonuclease HI
VESVGCAAITPGENKENQVPGPFSIFNAEAEAINTAISITRNTIQPKRVMLSDSLSCFTSLNGMRKIYNTKVVKMMNQIHREKEHLTLMWVPRHAGIQGNEKADQHTKAALQWETNNKGETGRNKTSRMDII